MQPSTLMKIKSLCFLLLIFAGPTVSQAQGGVRAQNHLRRLEKPQVKVSPWTLGFSSSYSNQVYILDDTYDRPTYTQSLTAGYRWNRFKFTANTDYVFNPEASPEEPRYEMRSMNFLTSHTSSLDSINTWITPFISISVPLSYRATRINSQRFSLSSGFSLTKPYRVFKTLDSRLGFNFAAGVLDHEYDESAGGQINPHYFWSPTVSASLSYKNRIGLSGSFGINHVIDYRNKTFESFSSVQSLFWNINKNNQLSLGHSHNSSVLQPNGQSQEFRVASELYSSFFVLWSLTL